MSVLSLLGGASSYDAAIKEEDLRMPQAIGLSICVEFFRAGAQ
jgi:hypothetical protein